MSISIKILGSQPLASVKEVEQIDFCFCGIDCYDSYVEKAFTADASAEDWQKDKASFLFRKIVDADTINVSIYKSGAKVADVIDNTYGTYYSTFDAQPLYTGFIADWSLIRSAFGTGYYTIMAERTILGQSKPFASRTYFVLPYSDRQANETVRLETYTQGNILSSEFDYQDLIADGWYQSIRLSGRFGNVTPTLIEDRLLNSDRQVVSVQDSIENEYTLFTRYLPESAKKQLINQQALTTSAIVTDYNLLNDEVIRQLPVVISAFEEVKHQQRGTAYTIKFKDRFNNTILRTF